jgi:hypothetical protein
MSGTFQYGGTIVSSRPNRLRHISAVQAAGALRSARGLALDRGHGRGADDCPLLDGAAVQAERRRSLRDRHDGRQTGRPRQRRRQDVPDGGQRLSGRCVACPVDAPARRSTRDRSSRGACSSCSSSGASTRAAVAARSSKPCQPLRIGLAADDALALRFRIVASRARTRAQRTRPDCSAARPTRRHRACDAMVAEAAAIATPNLRQRPSRCRPSAATGPTTSCRGRVADCLRVATERARSRRRPSPRPRHRGQPARLRRRSRRRRMAASRSTSGSRAVRFRARGCGSAGRAR